MNKKAKDRIFTREFLLLSIWAFFVSNNFYALLTTIPLYSLRVLKLTETEAGLAAGLFIAGMLCSRFLAGKLTERLGFRLMLVANSACLIFFTILYSYIETATSLYLLRVASGFFFGLLNNTLITVASSIIPKSRTGEGIGYYSMIQMTAWAVGPYFSIYFANRGDYDHIFLFCTILPAIVLATIPFLRMKRIQEAIARDDEPDVIDQPDETIAQTGTERKGHFLSNIFEMSIFPIALVCVFVVMFNTAVTSFAAPFAETIGLADAASVFFIFFVAGLIGTRPLVSKLFDRKGATFVLIPGIIIYTVAYLALATANSHFAFLLAAFLVGMGLGACQNTTLSLALSMVPRRRLGFANATYYASFDTCAAVGPLVAGLLIPAIGYRYMFIVAAIWTIIGIPIYLVMSRKFLYKSNKL